MINAEILNRKVQDFIDGYDLEFSNPAYRDDCTAALSARNIAYAVITGLGPHGLRMVISQPSRVATYHNRLEHEISKDIATLTRRYAGLTALRQFFHIPVIPENTLEAIAQWGFHLQPGEYRSISQARITYDRDMDYSQLLVSIHITFKERGFHGADAGIHLCIMRNGDCLAREFPYYDGILDQMVPVHNQRMIVDLLKAVFSDRETLTTLQESCDIEKESIAYVYTRLCRSLDR